MRLDPLIDAILVQHGLVLGKTRSGKSSTLRLMVERILKRHGKSPVCIVDPKGDWWGLRSGFPVVVFGGEHADVPLEPNAGPLVADLFGREGHSCVIDLGGWTVADRIRFFTGFAQSLFAQPRVVRHLFIDEVHNFAPQGKVLDPESGKMLHWANRLASEGSGKGITLWSASQRPQKVHKDFVTCSETLIAMRVIHPLDRAAIKDWMDGADPTKASAILTELAQMPRGTGWVWSPEAKIGPIKQVFPKFETFDSFAAPDDTTIRRLWKPKKMDLAAVRSKMQSITTQAAANDPAELRKRIRELEKQVQSKVQPVVPSKPVVDTTAIMSHEVSARAAQKSALRFTEQVIKALRPVLDAAGQFAEHVRAEYKAGRLQVPAVKLPALRATGALERPPAVEAQTSVAPRNSESIPKGEIVMLRACVEHGDAGCTREQLTILTGYKQSSRNAYISRLVSKGYLIASDADNRVRATATGTEALGDYEPLPRGDALLQHWMAKLPEGEAKVLSVVVAAYPRAVARDDIDAGYKVSSRNAYISRLAARELVSSTKVGVTASALLFD